MPQHDPAVRRAATRVVMAAFRGPDLPPWAERLLGEGLGSVCLFGSNVVDHEQVAALSARVHAAGDRVLVTSDEEGGDVTRLHMRLGSPAPGSAALGAADDLALTRAVHLDVGHELASVGVDLDLAPVADVNSNPRNPVIGVRSLGADPELVSRHVAAAVQGLQAAGVGACVKHFPGHGDTAQDSHLDLPVVDAPLEVLRARELAPFGAAVQAGALAVMTSHVLLPALDPLLPATLSPTVLGLLRADPGEGGLGFDGLLVSDAIDMRGASGGRGEPAAAVLAVAAGVDLLCLGADKDEQVHLDVVAALEAAVHDGSLPAERLLDAARRVDVAADEVARLRRAAEPPSADTTSSARAAAAAVRVQGDLPDLAGALVVRVRTGTNVAVGEVPWGLPDPSALPDVLRLDVDERTDADQVLAAAGGRPLVVLVREQHRHAWVGALLDRLAAARPDLVAVEMGWPGPDVVPGGAVVHTFGASRANAGALDAVLSGGSRRVRP
ncbi:glycoside hydrolase family 3 N-terminal domain-containing protein [Angustibacter aerolatus]